MKLFKIIISLALCVFSFSMTNVKAQEINEVYGGEYISSEEEVLENEKIALENAKKESPQTRMDEIEYSGVTEPY